MYASRNNGHRNQRESHSDAATHVVNHDAIVISDEDDDDDEHEYTQNVGMYIQLRQPIQSVSILLFDFFLRCQQLSAPKQTVIAINQLRMMWLT